MSEMQSLHHDGVQMIVSIKPKGNMYFETFEATLPGIT